ncbi:heterokaryon incompatibility protein-domain-containing protein [Hypoxylon rubiginosum]|uniref:Heterokaryon incompatibility protein-domain-containing protein n=1 Tax=Hypoxylon rubiginosum TaxID=110542 RepID=A0ACC0D1H1_9PEZI|nr:heterokaryon incompatibility protein-domain-containing protein [Hypoxylon rubiginosum]
MAREACTICRSILLKPDPDSESTCLPMHTSLSSLYTSLEKQCPICIILWRHIRSHPLIAASGETTHFKSEWAPNRNNSVVVISYEIDNHQAHFVLLIMKESAPKSLFRDYRMGVEKFIASTPVNDDPMSEPPLKRIQSWMGTCKRYHPNCAARLEASERVEGRAPARFIDLHGPRAKTWSLVDKVAGPLEYAALSHMWTADIPQLTQGNLDAFKNGQLDEILPMDYQHAMALCRALSVRYIWIDSLCILQDSKADFDREAATMSFVYTRAVFTISICQPSDLGCVRKRDASALIPEVFFPSLTNNQDERALVLDEYEWDQAITQAPINNRGWVFQERTLSQRILYLGNDQYYWECDDLRACEVYPKGFLGQAAELSSRYYRLPIIRKDLLDGGLHATWPIVIEKYTSTSLTFQKDKLVALSGVARQIASVTGDQYLAGLWKSRLLLDLLWYSDDFLVPQNECFSPSWSWASTLGPVRLKETQSVDMKKILNFAAAEWKPLARVRDTCVCASGQDPFGDILSASINLTCLMIRVEFPDPRKWSEYEYSSPMPVSFTLRSFEQHQSMPAKLVLNIRSKRPSLSSQYDPTLPCFLVPLMYKEDPEVWTNVARNGPEIEFLIVQPRSSINHIFDIVELKRIGMFSVNYSDSPMSSTSSSDSHTLLARFRALIANTLLTLVPGNERRIGIDNIKRGVDNKNIEREEQLLFESRLRNFTQSEIKSDLEYFALMGTRDSDVDLPPWPETDMLDAEWSTVRLV